MRDILVIALRAFLLLFVTVFTLEVVLQLAYPSLPKPVIDDMPQYLERVGHRLATAHGAREFPAGQVVEYDVTPLSGDLYKISCLSPEDAQPMEPYRVSFKRDGHGFRNEEPWPDKVNLVVIGDSFTAAEHIQRPFWQGLSDLMLVFAAPGTGTLEQQRYFNAFALPRQPELALIAFFAGNDLRDSLGFAQMQREGLTRQDMTHQNKNPLDYSVVFHLLRYLAQVTTPVEKASCHYPLWAQTDPPTPVAFYNKFLPLLGMDKESLLASEMIQITRTSISEMARETQSKGGQLILMYIPQKAELYWDYLDDASKEKIIAAESLDRSLAGLENIDANLSAQREVMRELADEIGVSFLDLTEPLAAAIRAGQAPYFFADTHWNQDGHNIARNALLDFLNRSNLDR